MKKIISILVVIIILLIGNTVRLLVNQSELETELVNVRAENSQLKTDIEKRNSNIQEEHHMITAEDVRRGYVGPKTTREFVGVKQNDDQVVKVPGFIDNLIDNLKSFFK